MSVHQLEIAKPVVFYSLMIWFCFLGQNLVSSWHCFADACDTAGMKISMAKTEVLHLLRNPDQCMLQVNGATLKQIEKFKYLGVAFTRDGGQDEKLDTRIGNASEVIRALRYLVIVKRELSNKAKLSIFKTVFVLILT